MRQFICALLLAHAVLAGDLYSPQAYSPVGVAYSAAPVVPQPVAPLHYASPLRTSVGYGPLAAARFNSVSPLAAPSPFIATAPAPAPLTYSAVAPSVLATPFVKQYAAVPAVADVPITRYEATPGIIQKYVDVAHPKLATTKIQIRRPAIQKQFYDIEERIIVRPVASAVVELDQPLSKTQSGPTLVSPAISAPGSVYPAGVPVAPVPVSSPVPVPPLPPAFGPSPPPTPTLPPSVPQNQFPTDTDSVDNGQNLSDDADSVTVENEDFSARSRSQGSQQNFQQPQQRFQQPQQNFQQPQQRFQQPEQNFQQPQQRLQQLQQNFQQLQQRFQQPQQNFEELQPQQQPQPQPDQRNQQEEQPQTEQQTEQQQERSGPISSPQQSELRTQARFLGRSQFPQLNNNYIPQSRAFQIPDVIPSSRTSLTEEQSQANQQRLIELLTSRGGVEVRSGVSVEALGEAGQIRGRVLSVTPAPPSSGPANENVSTRRVVVSRPIQTLQEVDVVQPFTKVHRLSVQQPALLKTPRIDIARVKTLAPVPVTSYAAPYAPYPYYH